MTRASRELGTLGSHKYKSWALQAVLGKLEAFTAAVPRRTPATCTGIKNSVTVTLTALIARKDI